MRDAGGYDAGYQACPCFWGREAASYVKKLNELEQSFNGWRVLDVGSGEGKNAIFFAERGARVQAVDLSIYAVANARDLCGSVKNVQLAVADALTIRPKPFVYDAVIAYGLLHCLASEAEVHGLVRMIQEATRFGGYNVVCAFNSGRHDLTLAHPGFSPLLIPHTEFLELYAEWDVVVSVDDVLVETHPHNNVQHEHSLTRLIARKPYAYGELPAITS